MNSPRVAGFWRRLAAYTVDVIPIVLVTASLFYIFFGFDAAIDARFNNPRNIESHIEFLRQRNQIRDLSFLVWLIYSIIMEASPVRGTFGKWLFGIQVVDQDGRQLTIARSVGRNLAKLLSYLPLGLGFLWVVFNKRKQGWHDLIARTYVCHKSGFFV